MLSANAWHWKWQGQRWQTISNVRFAGRPHCRLLSADSVEKLEDSEKRIFRRNAFDSGMAVQLVCRGNGTFYGKSPVSVSGSSRR
jgi:hypothetical protein